jgi:hypothetical protein
MVGEDPAPGPGDLQPEYTAGFVSPLEVPWMSAVQARRVANRAWFAIALCAVLPVLIGVLVTAGTFRPAPPVSPPVPGHWVYVPSRGAAVHVDGAAKGIDATVSVGSASTGSPVLQDRHAAYLVDHDRVVVFSRGTGVTGNVAASGVAEAPVPVEAGGAAYLVYRTAGLIVRLGSDPVTVAAGGPLGAPVVTPEGRLWVHRLDTGELCLLADRAALSCPARVPADHPGALALLGERPVFVDVTAGTWQPLGDRGAGPSVALGVALPANAAVGAASVGGRLPVIDPAGRRLLLLAGRGDVRTVPLGAGHFGRPVATGGAVVVADNDTGEVTSYDGDGQRRAAVTVAGGVRLTTGDDGRVYADSTDGLQSVVMDDDGTLTAVHTTGDAPPTYRKPEPTQVASRPPATVAPTTTETIPPAPETVTVQVTPTTAEIAATGTTGAGGATPAGPAAGTPPRTPSTTQPPPGPPPGSPTVDVLSAAAGDPGQASIQIRVSGAGPVFCHVYFNSIERAATNCSGTMRVVANGLAAQTVYDIYVLGTNAKGTGIPGRRAQLRM